MVPSAEISLSPDLLPLFTRTRLWLESLPTSFRSISMIQMNSAEDRGHASTTVGLQLGGPTNRWWDRGQEKRKERGREG